MPVWLLKYWKHIVIVVAVAVLYLYWNGRNNTIEDLRKSNEDLKVELRIKESAYQSNLSTLEEKIAIQNAKITEAHQRYSELAKRAEIAGKVASERNKALTESLVEKIKLIEGMEKLSCDAAVSRAVDIALDNPWSKEK